MSFVRYFRIGQALTKKKIFKIFVGSDKSRTFASRLLSNKDKQLIHSELIDLCPGRLASGEEKTISSNILKNISEGIL